MTNMFDDVTDPIEAVKAKYNANPDEAWKALAHSQAFIETLKAEKAEADRKAAEAMTLEQAVAKLKESVNTPPSQTPTGATQPSVLDDSTLETKLETMLSKKAEQDRINASKSLVQEVMLEKFGTTDKAKEVMIAKSKELNMTPAALDAIALNSPQAFFTLIGIENTQRRMNPSPTMGTVRTGLTDPKPVDVYAPFREELKKDRNKAMSQEVQNEIMRKAFEQHGLKAY